MCGAGGAQGGLAVQDDVLRAGGVRGGGVRFSFKPSALTAAHVASSAVRAAVLCWRGRTAGGGQRSRV